MTDINTVATIIGSAAAGSVALAAGLSWMVRKFHRFNARFDNFMEDWHGSEARPGVPHRPGVMERLSQQDAALDCINERLIIVESEVNPNGGKSMKDIVGRVDGNLNHIRGVVEGLDTRVTRLERVRGARHE